MVAVSLAMPETRPRSWGRLFVYLTNNTASVSWLFAAGILSYGAYLSTLAIWDILRTSWYLRPQLAKRMTSLVRDHQPFPFKVLDINCGTGITSARLLQRFGRSIQLTCADTDPKEAVLRRNLTIEGLPTENVRVETIDWSYLPFVADSFDVVVSSMSLAAAIQGIDEPEFARRKQEGLLTELLRVCKPGGQLIVWDSAEPALFARFRIADLVVSETIPAFGGIKTHIVSGNKVGRG